MGMPPHGFTIDKFITNSEEDAHALVLRRGPRVVVAFRGSSSRKCVARCCAASRMGVWCDSVRVPSETLAPTCGSDAATRISRAVHAEPAMWSHRSLASATCCPWCTAYVWVGGGCGCGEQFVPNAVTPVCVCCAGLLGCLHSTAASTRSASDCCHHQGWSTCSAVPHRA